MSLWFNCVSAVFSSSANISVCGHVYTSTVPAQRVGNMFGEHVCFSFYQEEFSISVACTNLYLAPTRCIGSLEMVWNDNNSEVDRVLESSIDSNDDHCNPHTQSTDSEGDEGQSDDLVIMIQLPSSV